GPLEHAGHVALVRKAGSNRGVDQGVTVVNQSAHFIQLAHGAITGWTRAEGRAKLAGETPAIEPGNVLQLSNRIAYRRRGSDCFANAPERIERERLSGPGTRLRQRFKQVCNKRRRFRSPGLIDFLIYITCSRQKSALLAGEIDNGFCDEGKVLPV